MSQSSLSVSVVVISRNEERTVTACVQSALSQTHVVSEVIVVDGNSTDGTIATVHKLARRHDRVRLIIESAGGGQTGPAAARNLGAAEATGDLLLFMNADVRVDSDYVQRLIERMEAERLDAAAGLRWNVGESRVAGLMNVHYALNYNASPRTLADPAFLSGDALLIRADAFRLVGGYDPEMPSGEDADLGYRLKGVGKRIAYVPETTIWHDGRNYGTFSAWVKQMEWYGRGAAKLARLHPWRKERERNGLESHVTKPLSIALSVALMITLAAYANSLILFGIVMLGMAGLSFRYFHSLLLVSTICREARLPSQPQPIDLVLYPLFRVTRYGLLSFFTWVELMRSAREEPPQGAAGDRAV